jgi:hypothetical protein
MNGHVLVIQKGPWEQLTNLFPKKESSLPAEQPVQATSQQQFN